MKTGAPSLVACAERVIIRKIEALTDVGDMPWRLVQNIIAAIKVPGQLAALEDRCPQIKSKTKPLWMTFVKRDIEQTRLIHPGSGKPDTTVDTIVMFGDVEKSFSSVREVYYTLLKDQKARLAQQQATLKASLKEQAAIKAAQAPTIAEGVPRHFQSERPKYIATHGMRSVHRDQKSTKKLNKLNDGYNERRKLEQLARNNAPAAKQQANAFLEKRKADKAKADAEKAAYLAKKKTSSPPAPNSIPKKTAPSASPATLNQRASTITAPPKKSAPPPAAAPPRAAPRFGAPAAAESNKRKRSELAIETPERKRSELAIETPERKRARMIREKAMAERMLEEK